MGHGVDVPLGITRFGYADLDSGAPASTVWARFVVQPLWNNRAQGLQMAFNNGNGVLPLAAGDTTCPSSGIHRCVKINVPAAFSIYDPRRLNYPVSWHGSLHEDKADQAVAVTYRRNRYYDPTTGRFTQEDPIGLAGGLNLYGFAQGDPVNFSDPFGLRVGFADDEARQEYYRLRQLAFDAQFSDDKSTRSAGRRLLGVLNRVERDDRLVTIAAGSFGSESSHRNDPLAGGNFSITLNRDYRPDIALSVALAHEATHVSRRMVLGTFFAGLELLLVRDVAVNRENDARLIKGCAQRDSGMPSCN